MALQISSQYTYTGRGPLDAKMLVKSYAELLQESTWIVNNKNVAYNGMVVVVWLNKEDTSKNGVYFLHDATVTSTFKAPDVTNKANWRKLGEFEDYSNIASQLSGLDQRTSIVEASLAAIGTDVSANKDALATMGTSLSVLEQAKADHETLISKTNTKIVSIEETVTALGNTTTNLLEEDKKLNSILSALSSSKANISDVYDKTEIDLKVQEIIAGIPKIDLTEYAKLNDVSNAISEVNAVLTTKANAEDVYTKDEVVSVVRGAISEIPSATSSILGLVKASAEIAVGADGAMSINEVSTDKLTQGTDTLVLNGGSAAV